MNNGMNLWQAVLVLLVAAAGFIGWVLNIIALATVDLSTGMLVLRAAGIFVPHSEQSWVTFLLDLN